MNKVAVYGGGIVAMLMAIILREKSYEVELWRSKQQELKQPATNRVFALNRNSTQLLKDLGCFKPNQQVFLSSTLVKEMLIWDGHSASQISFSATEIGKSNLTRIVHERDLWDSIYSQINNLNIPIIDLAEEEQCHQQSGEWFCTQSKAQFLCIADGAHSKLRTQLQIPSEHYSYQQIAIVAKITLSQPKAKTAFQVFGAYGPLALLPLQDNTFSIVWSLDSHYAKHILSLSDAEIKEALREYLGGHLGDVLEIEGLKSYPLHMLHVKQYVGKNWLILGDAAHHFHPLAGLGLNMGIADVSAFREILTQKRINPISLGEFQRNRKASLQPIILGMNALKIFFGSKNLFLMKLRSFGLEILNQQNTIKKLLMYIMQEI